jgi:hypothetical protein
MTIAVALKVGDGVVLGADSASTLSDPNSVINVYFNAEKVFNLVKGLPIGFVTYGLGGLAGRSVVSLAKDLREQLIDTSSNRSIDKTKYTIEEVANHMRDFFYTDYYRKSFPVKFRDPQGNEIDRFEPMGFLVAGFSANQRKAEVWEINIDAAGNSPPPKRIFGPDDPDGAAWRGQPEALTRLMAGWSTAVAELLINQAGVPEAEAIRVLNSLPVPRLFHSAMPLQDAIDLVKFMIEVTVGFVRFSPGAPTVHEPVDVAAINFHEGFRWVLRKHYYRSELNPDLR